MVMEVDGRNILIDACVGEHKERPTRPLLNQRKATGFIARLAKLGLRPEDIDVVFCTHLHVDHVGWNTKLDNGRWVPTFPKARYLFGRKELDHWMGQPNRAEVGGGSFVDSVIPIVEAKQCDLVDDGHDLGKGLSLCLLPGHTPGQLGLDVRARQRSRVVRRRCDAFAAADGAAGAVDRLLIRTRCRRGRRGRRSWKRLPRTSSWLVPCHFRGPLGTQDQAAAASGYRHSRDR